MQGMHYRAIDGSGRIHKGFSRSRSFSELERWIRHRGWQPLPISSVQRISRVLCLQPSQAYWSKTSAALFSLNFSQLLSAGVPLLSALQELAALERQRKVQRALTDISERVEQGNSLSEAMLVFPGLFAPDYIAAVSAGERSGKLSHCLRMQAENLQWQAQLAQRFSTVLVYPVFALTCLFAVFLFVLLYLVPAMLPLLPTDPAQLPAHTRLLLSLSHLIRNPEGSFIMLVGAIGVLAGVLSVFTESYLDSIKRVLLRGKYGQILTAYALARYARNTSLLYESGVEITEAMQISQNVVVHSVLREQLTNAHRQVLGGQSLGYAMQSQPSLPALFVRMLTAGERAGVLDVAMRQCAEQLQANAQYSLDKIERLIGPVLLCVIGALLLWVVMSVLGPIYNAVGQSGSLL